MSKKQNDEQQPTFMVQKAPCSIHFGTENKDLTISAPTTTEMLHVLSELMLKTKFAQDLLG